MEKKVVNNYGSFDVIFSSGNNSTLIDTTGKEYIDFIAGIGVNSLGHNNPALLSAIQDQASRFLHISNYYLSDIGLTYSSSLLKETGFSGVYFGNSGAEANEAAIKLARKYGQLTGGEGKKCIVCLKNSFHGRTLATLSLTGQEEFHPPFFAPYPAPFKYIEANNFEELEAITPEVCAVIVETIQGEGGVNILDSSYLQALQEKTHANNALFMVDEVQTGFGRTGSLFSFTQFMLSPDVVTAAKGIAGGIPMSACLFRNKANNVFTAGDHQSTFGGNPLACSAASTVLNTITSPGFLDLVKEKGKYIRTLIKEWEVPFIKEVRGRGLMIGIELKNINPHLVQKEALKNHLCITTAGKNVVRLLPPLTITYSEIDKGLALLHRTLKSFC